MIVGTQGGNRVAVVAAVALVALVVLAVVAALAIGGLNWLRTTTNNDTDSGAPDSDITVPMPTAVPQDPLPNEGGQAGHAHWEMTW
jgi:hypothetical protein